MDNTLSFYSGDNQLEGLAGTLVFLVGAGRSGKTTVGNILGSCENAEHMDEPWLPMMLPVMAGIKMLSQGLAEDLFVSAIVELLYDRYLMRHVNFRPQDRSSIWKQKTPKEIFSRLLHLDSRDDVRRYAKEKCPTLIISLTSTLPFLEFVRKVHPACHIVHVVREGLEVAVEYHKKGWSSDRELLNPREANPRRRYFHEGTGQPYYLPYWVETGFEDSYLDYSDFARSLFYWRRQMEMAGYSSIQENPNDIKTIRLRDILNEPLLMMDDLINLLGLSKTFMTEALIEALIKEEPLDLPIKTPNREEWHELKKVRDLYPQLGFDTSTLDELLSKYNG